MGVTVLLQLGAVRAETLTAQRAVELAARQNPVLQAALHERAAAGYAVVAEQGDRLPSVFATAIAQQNERFNAAREGIVRNEDRLFSGELGVRYRTALGSDLEAGVQSDRITRNTLVTPAGTDVVSIGPNYGGTAYLSVRQPLLRGAGPAGVLGPLRQAEAGQRQSENETERVASQLVLDVLVAYWELWYAERAVAVQAAGAELAEQQLEQINRRVNELGTASRADALRFAAELASIRETLVQTQTQLRMRAIDVGWLLGTPPEAGADFGASSSPPPAAPLRPFAELNARLLAASPELAAMRAQLEVARLRAQVADNLNAPRLDLLASGTMTGLWTRDELPGVELPSGRPAFGAMVGLEFDNPLGTRRESGEAAQARAQWRAAQARYQALVNALSADAAANHAQVALSADRVRLAAEAEAIAEALAEAERQRFQLGSTTSLDVVLVQQNHRQTELRRLRAVVDQTIAQLQLEHLLGELLSRIAPHLQRRPPS